MLSTHKITIQSLVLFILIGVLAACSKSPAGAAKSKAQQGQTQQAGDVESRFAVFSPAIGVMLRDLGFEDSIVGKHTYDTALSDSIAVVGSHIDVDYEMLITLSPTDLFFEINTIEIPTRVKDLAAENDWQIWTYELKTLDDIATTIDDLYLKLVGFREKKIDDGNFLEIDIDPSAKFDIELPSARLANAWSPIGRPASAAGRMLVLASVDPPGAMGPGSFHAQLIDRLGVLPAITDGAMWQELDFEDMIELAPESILVFMPKPSDEQDLIGEPEPMSWAQIKSKAGGIADLPIPAAEHQRIAIIEHPLGLLPSSSLGQVADEVVAAIEGWYRREQAEP